MWVERNAMAANSRAGIKRHEPERLGRGGPNHFPGVDVQRITQPRHLVCHADVHCAKSIFKELGSFGYASRAYRVNLFNDLRIEMRSSFGRVGCHTTDHLG